MPKLTYAEILESVKKEGGIEAAISGTSASGAGFGGGTDDPNSAGFNSQDLVGRSIEIAFEPLPEIKFPMEDLSFAQGVSKKTGGGQEAVKARLSIKTGKGLFVNNYTKKSGQIVINSSRVLINANKDYLMLFGKNVAIASPGPVNIDSGDSITLYGEMGLFLGVPNKGEPFNSNIPAPPKSKCDPIPNQAYEPLVLGTKLAEFLDDLLVVMKNANIITSTGPAYFLEDTQYDIACLQSRIPEILSTYAYLDGISHEQTIKPPPTPPKTITPYPTSLKGTITAMGDAPNNITDRPPPTIPITSPLVDVPEFFEAVDTLYS